MKGSGIFSSAKDAITGSLATGMLKVILAADRAIIPIYRSAARDLARRNPQRIPQAEEFLERFSAAIKQGLEEGRMQTPSLPLPQVPTKGTVTSSSDLNTTRMNSAIRKGGKKRTLKVKPRKL
jgi:hypothetical protein